MERNCYFGGASIRNRNSSVNYYRGDQVYGNNYRNPEYNRPKPTVSVWKLIKEVKSKVYKMDKKIEGMDESMKAMQRRLDEVWEKGEEAATAPGGNAEMQEQDQDRLNPAAQAGAAGGTSGLGTDKNSGGELGAPTGPGYQGHVGGTGTTSGEE
jgi:hypothetical protein